MSPGEFSKLSLAFLSEINAFAHRLARDPWDAEDLVQTAYEKAFVRCHELRDPTNCRAWLFRIVRNLHLDRSRARTARPELRLARNSDRVGPDPSVSADTVERVTARELERVLTLLPEEQREAVLLCDLWGFSYAEIAKISDVPLGTVRSRIARGRETLLEEISVSGLPRLASVKGST